MAVAAAVALYQSGDKYFQDLDAVCAQRIAAQSRAPNAIEAYYRLTVWETQKLSHVEYPDGLADERKEILARKRREIEVIDSIIRQARASQTPSVTFEALLPRYDAVARDNNRRFAELGLDECTR